MLCAISLPWLALYYEDVDLDLQSYILAYHHSLIKLELNMALSWKVMMAGAATSGPSFHMYTCIKSRDLSIWLCQEWSHTMSLLETQTRQCEVLYSQVPLFWAFVFHRAYFLKSVTPSQSCSTLWWYIMRYTLVEKSGVFQDTCSLIFCSLLPVEGHAWAGVAWIQQHLYSCVNKKLEHFGKISFLIPYLVHRTKSWYFF